MYACMHAVVIDYNIIVPNPKPLTMPSTMAALKSSYDSRKVGKIMEGAQVHAVGKMYSFPWRNLTSALLSNLSSGMRLARVMNASKSSSRSVRVFCSPSREWMVEAAGANKEWQTKIIRLFSTVGMWSL